MRLKDQVVLVTGSTTGIGEAMAVRFAREGARVVIHGTQTAAGTSLAERLGGKDGRAIFIPGNLRDPSVPPALVQGAIERYGRLDALVNNAADTSRGNLESTTVESFDRTIAINLRAPLLLIQAALPHFRQQGGGRVLNIGSLNSYCGESQLLAYSASKAALVNLTRNLADAHGVEGIRVNLINVGWTLTANEYALKRREGLPEDWPQRIPKAYAPAGRIFQPEEVAAAALYFLSEEAALVNGSTLDLEQYPLIGRNPLKTA